MVMPDQEFEEISRRYANAEVESERLLNESRRIVNSLLDLSIPSEERGRLRFELDTVAKQLHESIIESHKSFNIMLEAIGVNAVRSTEV